VEVSPFPYQWPLLAEQVQGRDDLVADLVERVTERRVTALLGPRRYGKTSVLRRVSADVASSGTSVIWVDLYEVTSMVDIAVRFDEALGTTTGPARERVSAIAASLDLNLGLVRLSFTRPGRPDAGATLHALLDVAVRGALAHPTVLVLDEFSGIARVEGAAGLLRTKLQHHFQDIGVVFAGSEPTTMQALFGDRAEPFYAQADLVGIGPLDAATVDHIVVEGFRRTDRDPGPLGAHIVEFARGHPHRSMQIADTAWRRAVPGAPWAATVWEEAIAEIRLVESEPSERLFSRYRQADQSVLRLVASAVALHGRSAAMLGLSSSSATAARRRLVAQGDLIEEGGVLRVVDPVFSDWIRRRLPA
jgi:uncharacterized protein